MAEIGLFEAMYSARSLRRYKPDPIPDEVMTKVLEAATRAPSGSNQQNWIFVLVKDAEKRRKISEIYRRAAGILQTMYANRGRPAHMTEKDYNTLFKSASYLFDHMEDAPVLLFPCLKTVGFGPQEKLPDDVVKKMAVLSRATGASIYPAVQNIILACRAFGLGTVLTTIHLFFEDEVKSLLGIPKDVLTYALMPIGYPINKFGPVKRKPVSEVAFVDSYGNAWKG
ncbi:MAG TPA: nitroreductase family protein [Candidatus Binataceae bacterium]|nr:nitroreductase family protein [Candidatus Binataceae bacterium]